MLRGGSLGLLLAAALVGVTHTALGPDHTLPFVMLARAQAWSRRKTLAVTFVCGLGHVAAAFALVGAGVALGQLASRLDVYRVWIERFEGLRGQLAGWLFIAAGVAYALWGARHAIRERGGLSPHEHDGRVHIHARGQNTHRHVSPQPSRATFWMLFVLLVLGPCEPLLALFLPLAATGRFDLMLWTGAVFAVCTIGTMLAIVALAHAGLARLPLGRLERWSHAMAGAVIAGSGLGVVLLGL